jgi:hypothetical protein
MVNPDETAGFGSALLSGIVIFGIIIALFHYLYTSSYFWAITWIGIPVIAFLLSMCVHAISQLSACNEMNGGNMALGALPTIATSYIALIVSSIAVCRIPIMSVFAPMVDDDDTDPKNTKKSTSCCNKTQTLEDVEQKHPTMLGVSYGFYMIFARLFGCIYGSPTALKC